MLRGEHYTPNLLPSRDGAASAILKFRKGFVTAVELTGKGTNQRWDLEEAMTESIELFRERLVNAVVSLA